MHQLRAVAIVLFLGDFLSCSPASATGAQPLHSPAAPGLKQQQQQQQHVVADCRLVLQGWGAGGRHGVAHAQLDCVSPVPVAIAVSDEYLLEASQQFSGVLVDQGQACKGRAAALVAPTAMFALLYFCGDYHFNMVAPVLQNISLPFDSGQISNASVFLAFGGRVSATVTAGRVADNSGVSALLLMDEASVGVVDTAFFSNQGHQGLAAFVLHQAQLTVAGSNASSNVATEAGGVLLAQDNARVIATSSTFANNSVQTLQEGGGVVMASDNASVSLLNNTLLANHANFGGVAFMKGSSRLDVYGSVWRHNSAGDSGGCINAVDTSVVQMVQSEFIQNIATFAAVLETDNFASGNITSSSFSHNVAHSSGGVLYSNDMSAFSISSSTFDSNTAVEAGGAFFADDDSKVAIQHSNFSNNIVTGAVRIQGGGALYADTGARVDVVGSLFSSNRAVLGGGVFAYINSSIFIKDSSFVSNSAESGGGVLVAGTSHVSISNSRFAKNHATGQSRSSVAFVGGGGAAAANAATMTITNSALTSNTAVLGAGVAAVNAATLTINGSSVLSQNNASQDGGGVCLLGNAVLALSPSTQVVGNAAGGRGGGVSLANGNFDVGDVLVATGHNNTAHLGDSRVAVPVRQLTLVSNPFVHGYVSRGATRDRGNDSSLHAQLHVSGYYGLPCEGVSVRAMLEGTDFLAVNRSGSNGSVVLDLKVTALPGVYSIVFSLSDGASGIAPASLQLHVRSCVQGEVTPRPDTCEVCAAGSYSLNPANTSCDVCPEGALCPGGALILAQPGYWHSAPESPQMHRCPNPQACQGNSPASLAAQCDATGTASTGCASTPAGSSFSSEQCGHGYQGNLCGVCADGFGSLKPFTCNACRPASVIVGMYVAASVLLLAFMTLLCHLNRTASDAAAAGGESPADLLKPLVLYMQYMLIIAGVNVQLPEPLAQPLIALSWLWSAAAAPESLNIECAFPVSSIPLPLRKVVFYLCMPLAMLAAVLCIEVLTMMCVARSGRRRRPVVSASTRLVGSAMVTVFFFLPTMTCIAFGLFSCIPLDDDVPPPYVAALVGRFWVLDLNQRCFEGYHRTWALALGLPLAIAVCLVLPACIAMVTVVNRLRLAGPHFVRHYGFIYRAYKPACCYWECVVLAETVALVAIRVFGLTLGPFYQSLAVNVGVALILIILLVVRPYAQQQTGRVALHGMCCLLLTSYAVLSFVQCGGVTAGREYVLAVAVVTVVINTAFVCSVIWQLLKQMQMKAARFEQMHPAGQEV